MQSRQYRLSDTIPFGKKHRGETIRDAIENDPGYVEWCLDNVGGFDLDDEAMEQLDLALSWEEDL